MNNKILSLINSYFMELNKEVDFKVFKKQAIEGIYAVNRSMEKKVSMGRVYSKYSPEKYPYLSGLYFLSISFYNLFFVQRIKYVVKTR